MLFFLSPNCVKKDLEDRWGFEKFTVLLIGEEGRKSTSRTNSFADWPYLASLGYHLLVDAVAVLLSSSSTFLLFKSDGY